MTRGTKEFTGVSLDEVTRKLARHRIPIKSVTFSVAYSKDGAVVAEGSGYCYDAAIGAAFQVLGSRRVSEYQSGITATYK